MGKKRELKKLQRELKWLRRKNQNAKETYFLKEQDVSVPIYENHNAQVDQINEQFEELGSILKRFMSVLSSFLGKNFKLWEIKMEGLLSSVDLQKFVQDTSINPNDKSRGELTLFLIISSLDNTIFSSILYEFGEVHSEKIFWDILEMKWSMKWSEKAKVDEYIIVENDDCVDSLITKIETRYGSIEDAMINEESVYIILNEATCDNKEIVSDAVYNDLMNSTTKIVNELECAKDDE